MPTVTPAYIIYTPFEGAEQEIHFDAVISEDHKTLAEVTKFPVQTGFHVSNHSIRKNRPVSLTGIISNVKMDLGDFEPKTRYGSDPASYIKATLDSIILSGLVCKVVTNLGDYDPVVFTSFSTKQKSGMVDSMEFTISGEEIVIDTTIGFTAPTPITFTKLQGDERTAWVERLEESEVYIGVCDGISKGTYNKGQDFVIYDENSAGVPVETKYIFIGIDPSSGAEMYEVHISENSCAVVGASSSSEVSVDSCSEEGFKGSLIGGIKQIGGCLLGEATSIVLDSVENTIDTAMGKLVKSTRGLFYDTIEFAGGPDSIGGMITSAGISCIVRGATGNTDPGTYNPGESLPTTEQIMTGASEGLGFTEPPQEVVTLIQIRCDCGGESQTEEIPTLFPNIIG
jgi:hypothetical protein